MADETGEVDNRLAHSTRSGHVLTMTLLAAVCAVLAAWVVWDELSERHRAELSQHVEAEGAEIALRIHERFRTYRSVLRGAGALFKVAGTVDRTTWRTYVEGLMLAEDFPGIQGVGFSMWLEPSALERHVAAVRAEGLEGYRVWPEGARPSYSSIVMLEPLDWRNQRALGFDMYSEPVRREAMDRASQTGRAAMSGKTILVQETTSDVQAGMLIYVPVFARGLPTTTPDERRSALRGWVYMPFRMNNLMQGMLGAQAEGMRLRVYDQREDADSLLYDSRPDLAADERPEFRIDKRLTLAGRDWQLRLEVLRGYAAPFDARQAELAAIGLVGLLFVIVTWFLALTRQRAQALARASESLRRSETRYGALVNLAQEGIAATDAEFRLTFVNPSLVQLVGRGPEALLGRPLDELWRDDKIERRDRILARLGRGQGRRYETEIVRGDGRVLTVLVSDAPLADAGGALKGAIVLIADITERKDVERRIAHLATHDVLTGIPNRLMFSELLTHAVDQARRYRHRFAVLFVDLDHFKRVNDEYGHHFGDLLLREAVARMQKAVRSSDTLGRRGGDEFVVLLPEIESGRDAETVAEKIRVALERPFVIDGQELRISSSIGIALYPEHGDDEDTLLLRADEGMYRAKNEGRNRARYGG